MQEVKFGRESKNLIIKNVDGYQIQKGRKKLDALFFSRKGGRQFRAAALWMLLLIHLRTQRVCRDRPPRSNRMHSAPSGASLPIKRHRFVCQSTYPMSHAVLTSHISF